MLLLHYLLQRFVTFATTDLAPLGGAEISILAICQAFATLTYPLKQKICVDKCGFGGKCPRASCQIERFGLDECKEPIPTSSQSPPAATAP